MKTIYDFKDIHCHRKDKDGGQDDQCIVNLDYEDIVPPHGYYSIGLHPWSTAGMKLQDIDRAIEAITAKADNDRIIAIGECGLDLLRGASPELQEYAFSAQIKLSEKLRKPLIIHSVKSTDNLIRLKKKFNPSQQWIIHGFRGKKELATQLVRHGIALSFGEHFNAGSVAVTPSGMLFTESDESTVSIDEIRGRIFASEQCQ